MICDSYVIYVCPDPDCAIWDTHPGFCDDHNVHPEGDYPALKPITVRPRPEVLEAYYKPLLRMSYLRSVDSPSPEGEL